MRASHAKMCTGATLFVQCLWPGASSDAPSIQEHSCSSRPGAGRRGRPLVSVKDVVRPQAKGKDRACMRMQINRLGWAGGSGMSNQAAAVSTQLLNVAAHTSVLTHTTTIRKVLVLGVSG